MRGRFLVRRVRSNSVAGFGTPAVKLTELAHRL